MPKTLTDDSIDHIQVLLIQYLEEKLNVDVFDNNKIYDEFDDFFKSLLEPYSNGYRNYN